MITLQHIIPLVRAPALCTGQFVSGVRKTWACVSLCLLGSTLSAGPSAAETATRAFAQHCFSPYLTAAKVEQTLAPTGARVDFYDLRPFSSAAPSPVTGRVATPGTDRRCEVAFDGAEVALALDWITRGLKQEGLDQRLIEVPSDFPLAPNTKHAGAVQLNPDRIAVTQAGTRPGPNGVETFMNVERLIPLSEAAGS